ncbi:MAG: response regulator [Gemmatimonadales bacterium]|nr:MAG: response regulator [Gemmatimonadales bacterium]
MPSIPWAGLLSRYAELGAGPPLKILYAEDDPVAAELVRSGLRAHGWQVQIARDSMQAGMFAAKGQFDLILLDLQMPGGGGYVTLKRLGLSIHTADTPVIVVSGTDDERAPEKARRLGARAFVKKPVDLDELSSLIRSTLGIPDPSPS